MPIAGKVAPTYGGNWSADVQYDIHTYVRNNNNCYISKKPSLGQEPLEDDEFWFLALRNTGTTGEEELREAVKNIISGDTIVGKSADSEKFGGEEPSHYATAEDVKNITEAVLMFTDLSVPTDKWETDTTYESYPYKADIPCEGVTAAFFSDVVFNVADAISGNYAPVSSTEDGIVRIYASEIPSEDITIPTIKCVKAVEV